MRFTLLYVILVILLMGCTCYCEPVGSGDSGIEPRYEDGIWYNEGIGDI